MRNEGPIRLAAFVSIFALMAAWEMRRPQREPHISKRLRWTSNLGLAFLGAFAVRIVFPAAALGFAALAQSRSAGLLRVWVLDPEWAIVLGVVLLDFAIYFQHVVFHAVPILWRFHRVHHADPEFDVTTGMRFHPVELLLSTGIKGLAILALGPPIVAVMIFEVLLNASSIFNHANVRLPYRLDRTLRWSVVTPNMHRIHHSVEPDETNSNFGFNLSIWDRIFGTYRARARLSQEALIIGVRDLRGAELTIKLFGLLKLPFTSSKKSA